MVRLAQNEIHFGTYMPLQEVVEHIEAVEPDEIQALAHYMFQPEQISLTLLGPCDEKLALDHLKDKILGG
jgi:predicted Zn-dependent peptidase